VEQITKRKEKSMMIPLKYYPKNLNCKHDPSIVGRHKCGWVTNGIFMVRTNTRPSYRKIKLAKRQFSLDKFTNVIAFVDSSNLVPLTGPKLFSIRRSKKFIQFDNGVVIAKRFYDYFTSIGCEFAVDRDHIITMPIAITRLGEIVGYIMGISL